MEHLHALLLVFLEMTFLFVGLGMLHSQRRSIGVTGFYMSLGLVMFFASLLTAADFRAVLYGPWDFSIGEVVFYQTALTMLLLVYVTEGTLAAQRMILGAVLLYGLYLYVGELTQLQCNWMGFSLTTGISAPLLDSLLGETRVAMNAVAVGHLLDFFVVPIVYTRLTNLKFRRFGAIFGALLTAQLLGVFFRLLFGLMIGEPDEPGSPFLNGPFLARLAANFWLGTLLTIYLAKIEGDARSGEKSTLDIFFAFFGSYGRSKELEANLREWEDRYRIVLENAGELVLLLTTSGRILDANIAAGRMLGVPEPGDLVDFDLFEWIEVLEPAGLTLGGALTEPVHFRCRFRRPEGEKELQLSASLSPLRMRGQSLLVMIGRDITEEIRLAEEKSRLAEQLAHSQRIEALGMLAGGIAHDFNNYIHAILGHVDVITMLYPPENPEVTGHLEKVTAIAEQAGNLTSQLLGFARKGKYQVVELDLEGVLRNSLALLGPRRQQDLTVEFRAAPGLDPVRADAIQLQQVVLNLLMNATDAMENNTGERRLTLAVGPAVDLPVPFEPPPDFAGAKPEEYAFLQVADNGCGMDAETRKRLFEPFFTTKPIGRGTGMGLAMVYGTVTHHHGWIQLETAPGKGTAFYLLLPKFPAGSLASCAK